MTHNYPTSDRRKEILSDALAYARAIEKTILDIQKGETESKACSDNNINKSRFRHFISNPNSGYKSRNVRHIGQLLATPAEKIYAELFGINLSATTIIDIPHDTDKTVCAAMSTVLNSTEQDVLHAYYYENISMPKIAERMGLSKARVGQIRSDALRKLRRPENAKIIKYGMSYYEKEKELRKAKQQKTCSSAIKELESKIQKAILLNDANLLLSLYETCGNLLSYNTKMLDITSGKIAISTLGLSTRSENALYKNGILSLQALDGFDEKSLNSLRTAGKVVTSDIISTLRTLGLINDCNIIDINLMKPDVLNRLWQKQNGVLS